MSGWLLWYLRLMAGLTLISGLGQLLLPGQLGASSAWGIAPGWQREIAFWDLAMYLIIAGTLRANDAAVGRRLAIALVVLQLMVATNPVAAAVQSHPALNTIMAVADWVRAVRRGGAPRGGALDRETRPRRLSYG